MLVERRITRIFYDPAKDRVTLSLEPSNRGGATGRAGLSLPQSDEPATDWRSANLLLDAQGFLVGVDLGGGHFSRVVFMAGPHEAVASTRDFNVVVTLDATNEIGEVRVNEAKERGFPRVGEPNPYVG